jgi:hypothetical protein
VTWGVGLGSNLDMRAIRRKNGRRQGQPTAAVAWWVRVKDCLAHLLVTTSMLAVVVTVSTTVSASPIALRVVPRTTPNAAFAASPAWHERPVSTTDLEGPPVVVPGTDEAFALRGNDGEEVATEPLERVNLQSGDVVIGPSVPDDALLSVVGARVVVTSPARYGADGVAIGPWRIWTVDPSTLQLEGPVALPFVTNLEVAVPSVDPTPDRLELWVSNGAALRLVDIEDGSVRRFVRIPALRLSIDPIDERLYVLTGTGGSIASATSYRAGTIVELNEQTGAILASTNQWSSSPRVQIAASAAGVYLLDTGRRQRSVVLLDRQSLRPEGLPAPLETAAAKTYQSGEGLSIAPVEHGVVFSSTGRLTCISSGVPSIRTSTPLAASSGSWTVFGRQGRTLFLWNAASIRESSRIEAITTPSIC